MNDEHFEKVFAGIKAIEAFMQARLQIDARRSSVIVEAFGFERVIKASKPWFTRPVDLSADITQLNTHELLSQDTIKTFADNGMHFTSGNIVKYNEHIVTNSMEGSSNGLFVHTFHFLTELTPFCLTWGNI
jgi:hypothetical protein